MHEHSRSDRDQFVSILFGNIQRGAEHNFGKVTNDTHITRNTPFDVASIMMYGARDFGTIDSTGQRMTTIQPLEPGVEIR